MSRILFAPAYFYKLDDKQWSSHQPYAPLGTLYAASFLRSFGYEIYVHDTHLSDGPHSLSESLKTISPKYLIIYDDGFNYLTKMCLNKMREAGFEMIQLGKQMGCTVIISSSDSTDNFEKYLEKGADYVIRGEGEKTLHHLIESLEAMHDPKTVEGVSFKSVTGIFSSPHRAVLKDLDTLPMPAWDLIDVEAYKKVWRLQNEPFHLNVATTRGCPYKCNWCAKPIYGNRYNARTPQNVVEELQYLSKKYNVNYFWMCDDIFGLKPGWVTAFREEIEKTGLQIKYKIQSRADLFQEEATVNDLWKSGLYEVWLGVESGSQRILDAMDKGITTKQIHEATLNAKQKCINVGFFIQLGYLGETLDDIKKTSRLILKEMPDKLGISVAYPLPGTKFYEKVKEDLKTKTNWTDSADLAMMFQNLYPPAYYRKLHHFIHLVYQTKRSRLNLTQSIKHFRIKAMRDGARWIYYLVRTGWRAVSLITTQVKVNGLSKGLIIPL